MGSPYVSLQLLYPKNVMWGYRTTPKILLLASLTIIFVPPIPTLKIMAPPLFVTTACHSYSPGTSTAAQGQAAAVVIGIHDCFHLQFSPVLLDVHPVAGATECPRPHPDTSVRPSVRLLIFNILWADGPTSRSVGVVAEVQPDCYVMYDETLERRTLA